MAKARKNKWTAIILAIVGGWCGVHKYYLTDSWGHLLRLFVWPLSWAFAVYEAVILLSMAQDDFDAIHNRSLITASTNLQIDMVTQQRLLNEKKALERQNELEELRFRQQKEALEKMNRPLTSEEADQLIAWKNLKESGMISEIEFEEKRRQIMGK